MAQISDLQKGLVGHWTMNSEDVDNGQVRDRSAYDNHGMINGPTTGKSSVIGQSFDFDGNNDYVDISNNSAFNSKDAISVSAWANFSDNSSSFIFEKGNVNNQYSIFSHGDDIVFRTNPDDGSGYDTLNIQRNNYSDISTNTWIYIVGTFDGTTKRLYVNGTERINTTWDKRINIDSGSPSIGRFGGTSIGYYFTGKIDEVRVYNRALSQPEISQLYNQRSKRVAKV